MKADRHGISRLLQTLLNHDRSEEMPDSCEARRSRGRWYEEVWLRAGSGAVPGGVVDGGSKICENFDKDAAEVHLAFFTAFDGGSGEEDEGEEDKGEEDKGEKSLSWPAEEEVDA